MSAPPPAPTPDDYAWPDGLRAAYEDALFDRADALRPVPDPDTSYPHFRCVEAIMNAKDTYGPGMMRLVSDAAAAGATLYFSPPVFPIHPTDEVSVACHQGTNRSQVAFLALLGAFKAMGVANPWRQLWLPHGAETGFDPHPAAPETTEENWVAYINDKPSPPDSPDILTVGYQAAFGRHRARLVGEEQLSVLKHLNPTQTGVQDAAEFRAVTADRATARGHFDAYYWTPRPRLRSSGRRVFIMLGGSAGIGLRRLLEVAAARHARLDGVVIVALPLPDSINLATSDHFVRARLAAMGAAGGGPEPARRALATEAYVAMLRTFVGVFRPALAVEK